MLTFAHDDIDVTAICDALMHGDGAVKITGLFTPDQIAEARAIIMAHSDHEGDKVTHFQGAAVDDGRANLQRRVWNLLAKGAVFSDMAAHPLIMAILRRWLGSEFIMGSIAANRILPGGPGQEPHIDFPYWDCHAPDTHPMGLNASFPMNAQITVLLDPFTERSGATAYLPGSQKDLRYPTSDDHPHFYENCARMTGVPGDTVLFFGAAWHCAMPNGADHDRNAVLINYIPKWVKPLEDMPAALPASFMQTASADMRQLLGLNYRYPELLDQADAINAEGIR